MRRFVVGGLRRLFGGGTGVFAPFCLRCFVAGFMGGVFGGRFAAGVFAFFRVVSFGAVIRGGVFLGGVFLAADFDGGFCGLSGR